MSNTNSPTFESSFYAILISPSEEERAAGAALVETVSRRTGYPNPDHYSEGELAALIAHRQNHAYATLLAQHTNGDIIGHLLLEYANAPEWVTFPPTRSSWEKKHLMEIGGGAVHPDYQRKRIMTHLMEAALQLAGETNDTIVTSTWENGPSETALASHPDWVRLGQHQPPHAGKVVTFLYAPSQEQ